MIGGKSDVRGQKAESRTHVWSLHWVSSHWTLVSRPSNQPGTITGGCSFTAQVQNSRMASGAPALDVWSRNAA